MKREKSTESFDRDVIEQLEQIRHVDARNSQDAALGRAKFLQQAQTYRPTVSQLRKARHTGWINSLFLKKERTLMTTLVTIFLIVALALGGGGVTVAAAQVSQPDDLLYGLKLASEDAQFGMTTQEQPRLELALRFANRRAEELAGKVKEGAEAPAEVAARWEQQVQTAMQIAAGMNDEAMKGALVQVQTHLQAQEQLMNQASETQPGDQVMQQVRTQLQLHSQQIEQGLGDPQAFRNMIQTKQSTGPGEGGTWAVCDPDPYCGYGPGPGLGGEENPGGPEEPGNPWVSDEEYPGPGYGPGPGEGEPSQGENGIQDGNSDGNSANGGQQQGGNGNGQNGGDNGDGNGGSGGGK